MLTRIKCPHCGAESFVDTHWVTSQVDRIKCNCCGNDYPAHLWQVVERKVPVFIFR